MARARLDADEHRVRAGLALLERGDELERVGRHHAVVVVGGGDQGGRVAHARLQVVERRVRLQVPELGRVVAGAVLHGPAPPNRELVEAEHVHDAHRRQGDLVKLGALGHASAHEQPAVGAAGDGQPLRRGVFFADQVLGRGDEVVEHVLLLFAHAGLVPALAVLAAAPQVGHGVDAAAFQPEHHRGAERRGHAGVEAAVGVQVGGVVAGERQALLVHDEHGNLRAVLRGVKHLLGLEAGRVEGELGATEQLAAARLQVVLEDHRRIGEVGEGVEQHRVLQLAVEAARRSQTGELDLLFQPAVQGVLVDAGAHVHEVGAEQLAAGGRGAAQHVLLFGDDGLPVLRLGPARVDQDHPVVGRAVVRVDEEALAHVVDDRVVVPEARAEHLELAALALQVADAHLVAVSPLGAGDDQEAPVLGHAGAVVAQRMLGVLEHEAVLRLRVAQLVEVDLLVFVPGGELLARLGGVVAAVVEAVAAPGRAGELDPLQVVRQLAAAGHAHDLQLAPVGAGRRVADHDVAVVLGETGQAGPRGAVLRERIGVEEDLGLAGQALLVIGHALVLEAVVL